MKIRVDADRHRFTIPFPVGLVLNGISTRFIVNYLKNNTDVHLTAKQLKALCKELKQAKRTFGNLLLVDVRTSDDKKVQISL